MAKYNITDLNYIAVGANRCFINMDIQLGYQVYDYLHLLCAETETSGYETFDDYSNGISSALCVDIGTEQGEGYWYPANYIKKAATTSGRTKKNIDGALSKENYYEQVILNERQSEFIETDPSSKRYIRLYLSCCTIEMKQKIAQFNKAREKVNCTYVADIDNFGNNKNNLTGVSDQTYADDNGQTAARTSKYKNIYDIIDVTIQTQHVHDSINSFLHDTDYRHEMYLPQLQSMPLGFCQSQDDENYRNDALILTQGTNLEVMKLKTDLLRHRGEKTSQLYDTAIENDNFKTYTYQIYSEWQPNQSNTSRFTPKRNYLGVKRSYIADMPVDSTNIQASKATDRALYDNGEIYCNRLHTSKSTYDSMYTMNMDSLDALKEARKYCEINTCAGKPYLKFYDYINYNVQGQTSSYNDVTNMPTVSSNCITDNQFDQYTVPYQKIEFLLPADYNYTALHKSNAFNVNILSTNIEKVEDSLNESYESLEQRWQNADTKQEKEQIEDMIDNNSAVRDKLSILKFEITNAVRQIAEHISPANTQLVDVKFGGEK